MLRRSAGSVFLAASRRPLDARTWVAVWARLSDGDLVSWQPTSRCSSHSRVDFRKVGPWEEIRSALLLLKSDIRVKEITEAMNVLKNLPAPIPRSFLYEIRDLLLGHLDQLRPREASDLFHSCVKLQFLDPTLCTAIARSMTAEEHRLGELDNRGLTTLLYSLGQMKRHLGSTVSECIPEGVHSKLLNRTTAELPAPQRWETFDSRFLVNSLYALGLLNYSGREEVVQFLLEKMFHEDVLTRLNEQELSMVMTTLEELPHEWSAEQWALVDKEMSKEARRRGFSRQGLVNVLRRLGSMGFPNKETLTLLATESIQPERMKSYNGQDLANLVHTIAVRNLQPEKNLEHFEPRVTEPTVMKNFREQELCNVIYSFALSKTEEKESLFRVLSIEAVRKTRLPRYTQQGLSILVYSFGLVKFHDVNILNSLGEECTRLERLKEFSEQALSNMIYGLGRLRVDHGPLTGFAATLLSEAVTAKRLVAFNEQALSNLVYSLAQLKMPQYLAPLLHEVCKPARLSEINDQGLSNIVQSLSWLEYGNEWKLRTLLTEAAKRSRNGQLSEMATSNILTAIMGLGITDRSLLQPFIKRTINKAHITNHSAEELIAVLGRYARFNIQDYAIIRPPLAEVSRKARVSQLTNQQLVELLRVIWQLGMASDKAVPQLVKELTRAERVMEPECMAQAVAVLAWLQFPDQQVFATFCEKLTEDRILPQLSIHQVIQILQSLKPSFVSLEFIEPFVNHLCRTEILRQLEEQQLTDVLQFHVTFGLRDEERIEKCLQDMTTRRRIKKLSLKDIAISLECLLSMGMQELEAVQKLTECLKQPSILEQCRVHYVAKSVICLCRLGSHHKRQTMALVEKILAPPWDQEIVEKDLTEVLKAIKDAKFEYGKVGRLLNRRRKEIKVSAFLKQSDLAPSAFN